MHIIYTGMKESLQAVERTMNLARHHTLAIQQKDGGWGLCIGSFPRSDWEPFKLGVQAHAFFPLPNPLFETEEEARLFLDGDKDSYGINSPLVFSGEQLIGCVDDTSESFLYRPIDGNYDSIGNLRLVYTDRYDLFEDIEAEGCTVIDIY